MFQRLRKLMPYEKSLAMKTVAQNVLYEPQLKRKEKIHHTSDHFSPLALGITVHMKDSLFQMRQTFLVLYRKSEECRYILFMYYYENPLKNVLDIHFSIFYAKHMLDTEYVGAYTLCIWSAKFAAEMPLSKFIQWINIIKWPNELKKMKNILMMIWFVGKKRPIKPIMYVNFKWKMRDVQRWGALNPKFWCIQWLCFWLCNVPNSIPEFVYVPVNYYSIINIEKNVRTRNRDKSGRMIERFDKTGKVDVKRMCWLK